MTNIGLANRSQSTYNRSMQNFFAAHYDFIRALHVIAVIAWMSALLYLPRLFAYHAGVAAGSEASELFKVMESRLLRIIANPAMIAVILLGISMAYVRGMESFKESHWLHAKLMLVVGMAAFHGFTAKWRKDFAADRNTHTAKFYRRMNEVPTILMIGIVLLVVIQPF